MFFSKTAHKDANQVIANLELENEALKAALSKSQKATLDVVELATIDNINKLIAIHSEVNEGVEYELLPPSREEATSCIMSTGLITTHYGAEQPARLKATITTVKPIL